MSNIWKQLVHDHAKLKNNKAFKKIYIEDDKSIMKVNDERILITCNVTNYEEVQGVLYGTNEKVFARQLILTTGAIYNINTDAYKIQKRRTPLEDVSKISFALMSNEFLIHCDSSYDIRVSDPNHRKQFIDLLVKTLLTDYKRDQVDIYWHQVPNLKDFVKKGKGKSTCKSLDKFTPDVIFNYLLFIQYQHITLKKYPKLIKIMDRVTIKHDYLNILENNYYKTSIEQYNLKDKFVMSCSLYKKENGNSTEMHYVITKSKIYEFFHNGELSTEIPLNEVDEIDLVPVDQDADGNLNFVIKSGKERYQYLQKKDEKRKVFVYSFIKHIMQEKQTDKNFNISANKAYFDKENVLQWIDKVLQWINTELGTRFGQKKIIKKIHRLSIVMSKIKQVRAVGVMTNIKKEVGRVGKNKSEKVIQFEQTKEIKEEMPQVKEQSLEIPQKIPTMTAMRPIKKLQKEKKIEKEKFFEDFEEKPINKIQNEEITLDSFEPPIYKITLPYHIPESFLIGNMRNDEETLKIRYFKDDDLKVKEYQKRFDKESQVYEENYKKNKSNPFIYRYKCKFTDKRMPEGEQYLASEYFECCTLGDMLKEHRTFSEKHAKQCAIQIILGLEYLHKKGIIYEDLTPRYISVDRKGYLILSDFVSSKHIKTIKGRKAVVITPHYAAPEIFRKSLRISPDKKFGITTQVNWYSLGVIMQFILKKYKFFSYKMLMGECPIKKKGDLKTFFRKTLQEDDPKPFNKEINVSDEAKEFVFKLLTKDPAKRLGFYGEEGIKKIKSHPWFSKPEEIIWYDYLAKNFKPVLVPQVRELNESQKREFILPK